VVYLRTRQEYLEQSFAVLDDALCILSEDANATFLVEAPYLLHEWFAVRPHAREPVRRFVQEGRFDVSPGMYVMPDMTLPDGEWLNLQAETGFQWCDEHLGYRPRVCWMPAPWNHPATLPQWLAKCGYEAYVFSRGADIGHPSHFRWRGVDGTEILAARMPLNYDRFPPTFSRTEEADERFSAYLNRLDLAFPPGQPVLVPLGADFASPVPETSALIARAREGGVNVRFSTLPRFTAALKEHWSELPVMPSDFSPTFQGTFSSRVALKRSKRLTESLVDRLRRYEAGGGSPDPKWRDWLPIALRHQFHKTISGSIIDAANEEAAADYASMNAALASAFPRLARQPQRHVFNPSTEPRDEVVFLKGWTSPGAMDEAGMALESQRTGSGTLVRVAIPPLQTAALSPSPKSRPVDSGVFATAVRMENQFVRLDLDDRGNITQIVLRGPEGGVRLISGARPMFNTLSLEHDFGDFWSVRNQPTDESHVARTVYKDALPLGGRTNTPWVNAAGSFSDAVPKDVTVIESGPLRARLSMKGTLTLHRWHVEFEQTVTLHAGSPRIDFHTVVKPSAKFARVRAVFRPTLGFAETTYHVPFGLVDREPSEHAASTGLALHGAQAGLLLLNRGIPGNGWDGEALTLSLLRCVAMEYNGPSETGYESGTTHSFDYAIYPFRAGDPPSLCREGNRFNLPLFEVASPVAGPPFAIDASPNVEVTRVEQVPGGYRVHGYESCGLEGRLTVDAPKGWIGPVDVTGTLVDEPVPARWDAELRPFEMFMLAVVAD
jgi:alpha-mannosidase